MITSCPFSTNPMSRSETSASTCTEDASGTIVISASPTFATWPIVVTANACTVPVTGAQITSPSVLLLFFEILLLDLAELLFRLFELVGIVLEQLGDGRDHFRLLPAGVGARRHRLLHAAQLVGARPVGLRFGIEHVRARLPAFGVEQAPVGELDPQRIELRLPLGRHLAQRRLPEPVSGDTRGEHFMLGLKLGDIAVEHRLFPRAIRLRHHVRKVDMRPARHATHSDPALRLPARDFGQERELLQMRRIPVEDRRGRVEPDQHLTLHDMAALADIGLDHARLFRGLDGLAAADRLDPARCRRINVDPVQRRSDQSADDEEQRNADRDPHRARGRPGDQLLRGGKHHQVVRHRISGSGHVPANCPYCAPLWMVSIWL